MAILCYELGSKDVKQVRSIEFLPEGAVRVFTIDGETATWEKFQWVENDCRTGVVLVDVERRLLIHDRLMPVSLQKFVEPPFETSCPHCKKETQAKPTSKPASFGHQADPSKYDRKWFTCTHCQGIFAVYFGNGPDIVNFTCEKCAIIIVKHPIEGNFAGDIIATCPECQSSLEEY